jgi:glycosyltransferase involved in cell wall biosynthesis
MANYNNGEYVSDAIESVINQTYDNWELIIVDDASQDDSVEVISRNFTDERIKLFTHSENKGCGYTKGEAVKLASGDVVGILDADDALAPDALSRVAKAYLMSDGYRIVHTGHYWCDAKLSIINKNNWVGVSDVALSNLRKIKIHHFLTFEKELYTSVEGYDPDFLIAEDKDLIYQLEERSNSKFVNDFLYYYRRHAKGVSQKKKHYTKCWEIKAKYKAYKRRLGKNMPNLTRKETADLLYEGFIRSVIMFNVGFAKFFLWHAFKLNSNFLRIFVVIYSKQLKSHSDVHSE